MRRPRYVVSSVTGYDSAEGGHSERPRTDYYVLDRDYCHRVVATVKSRGKDTPGHHPKARAERLAANLNRGDEAWRDALARDEELTA